MMGRWAQRSRAGGSDVGLNFIHSAHNEDNVHVDLAYAQAIAADTLEPNDFQSFPSTVIGNDLINVSPKTLVLTMDASIEDDTVIVYSGANPAVLHPQTMDYT